jgi:ketosteroid isomerase-like protein
VSLDESKFPLSCCGDNLQRVSDILDKFPRETLSVLDEHYDYQVGETDMSRPITRQELHDVRVALMNEFRDLKYTVIESQQRMEAVLARVEMCLNKLSR